MIRLRQLEALSYVLSSRTITAASQLFGVTQPAMSRLIAQLEEEVGCQLLRRDRGRLRLTQEGAHFYEKAEQVLIAMRELGSAAEGLRRNPKGEVRIVSIYGLVNNLIPTAIAAFSAANPKVRITVDVLNRARLEEVIHERQFDIALATLPVKSPPSLTIDTLGALPAICIVPANHPLARKKVIKAADLANLPFVSERRETLLRQRVDEVFDRLSIPRVMQFECHNTEVICHMVGAGLGVSIIHPFVQKPTDGSFTSRVFDPVVRMEYAMFRQPRGEISNACELLAKHIMAETRKHFGLARIGSRRAAAGA
jgi:DNA-binding transcriptional LysR family regulator